MADKVGMKTIDFERAALLLSVQVNAAANGAMLSSLMSEAQMELLEMNKEATDNVQARAKQAQDNQSYAQPKALAAEEPKPAEAQANQGPQHEGRRK